mmetsp:Transcript_64509/g.210327  ORF Transcript_64509/g.210327 Transcript_64509/m.210327 type:complete len:229 (-) Transcript_64509:173-859(-)
MRRLYRKALTMIAVVVVVVQSRENDVPPVGSSAPQHGSMKPPSPMGEARPWGGPSPWRVLGCFLLAGAADAIASAAAAGRRGRSATEPCVYGSAGGGGGGGGGSVEGAPVALLARSRHLELRAAGAGGLRGGDDGCEEGAEATLDEEATEGAEATLDEEATEEQNAEPVMFAECSLTHVDAELWGLGHDAMSGLADTCKSCEAQGLKCAADQGVRQVHRRLRRKVREL